RLGDTRPGHPPLVRPSGGTAQGPRGRPDRPTDRARSYQARGGNVRGVQQNRIQSRYAGQAPGPRSRVCRAVRAAVEAIPATAPSRSFDRAPVDLSMSRPLAVTLGEPAGIGPDITLAAWRQRAELELPTFYLLADPTFLRRRGAAIAPDVPITVVGPD